MSAEQKSRRPSSLTFRVARGPPEVVILEDKRSLVIGLQLVHLLLENLWAVMHPFDETRCNAVRYGTVRCDATRRSAVQCGAVHCAAYQVDVIIGEGGQEGIPGTFDVPKKHRITRREAPVRETNEP